MQQRRRCWVLTLEVGEHYETIRKAMNARMRIMLMFRTAHVCRTGRCVKQYTDRRHVQGWKFATAREWLPSAPRFATLESSGTSPQRSHPNQFTDDTYEGVLFLRSAAPAARAPGPAPQVVYARITHRPSLRPNAAPPQACRRVYLFHRVRRDRRIALVRAYRFLDVVALSCLLLCLVVALQAAGVGPHSPAHS